MSSRYRIFLYDPISDTNELVNMNYFESKTAFRLTRRYRREEDCKNKLFILSNEDSTKRAIYLSNDNRPIGREAFNKEVTRIRASQILQG